jgi:hypothetical protein
MSQPGGNVKKWCSLAFTVMSLFSMLLCVAIMVLWVRSHIVEDHITFDIGRKNSASTVSLQGAVQLKWQHHSLDNPLRSHASIGSGGPAMYGKILFVSDDLLRWEGSD